MPGPTRPAPRPVRHSHGRAQTSSYRRGRDFLKRTACFENVHRVALTPEPIAEYDMPEQMGKTSDSRAAGFIRRHGKLVQVELDALPPDVLRGLYREALEPYWDQDHHEEVVEREGEDVQTLVPEGGF